MLVLERDEFLKIRETNPYSAEKVGKAVHIFFADNDPAPNREKLDALASPTEEYSIIGRAFFLHAPDGVGRSKLAKGAEKCLGVTVTARNMNTVNKIAAMLDK
ncbi:protein containing DUF1697 [Carpediemonas membranifera]|uniref:Protein containing DUF1697 n=1 Tax=Carpediemonas membranifera TaxID=201153 RepID=A0A8J6DZ59_9EUKA|nr:protein containing DUF1697 [Carpediemonas membranifera]|eukprot:KAG9393189.1 protein containing DUF1697 [Carpediemonas membranifera]